MRCRSRVTKTSGWNLGPTEPLDISIGAPSKKDWWQIGGDVRGAPEHSVYIAIAVRQGKREVAQTTTPLEEKAHLRHILCHSFLPLTKLKETYGFVAAIALSSATYILRHPHRVLTFLLFDIPRLLLPQ